MENIFLKKYLESLYCYHATYAPLLPSIKKNGLGNTKNTWWEDSEPGTVYLAYDPEVAASYAETNENCEEDWIDQIVILKIPMNLLDEAFIDEDENVLDDSSTFAYHQVIPWKNISSVSSYPLEDND